jgi:hypothetical protein
MLARLAAALFALSSAAAAAQSANANLQKLLNALVSGGEATLITPLANGMLQVTSFQSAGPMSSLDAVAVVDRARAQLQALGEPAPTADEIARMLAGGPINLPAGRIQAAGILGASGHAAVIQSQIVAAGTALPASAAAGGSAPPFVAREEALRQLAAFGILNPTEQEVRTALIGGTIATVNGTYQLPGILTR